MKKWNLSLSIILGLLLFAGCGDSSNAPAQSESPIEATAAETETVEDENIVEEPELIEPEDAVEIQVKEMTGNMFSTQMTVPVVEVTAIVDSVEVQDVIGNRGNCKMTSVRQAEFPRNLQFGEKATAGFTAGCNLIQIDVVTDRGTFSFNKSE